MPVVVVPADTPIGVPLVRRLRDDGAEVRAYATGAGDVAALRGAGAFVAVGDLDDEGRLDAAMTGAHTVIALHADPLAPDASSLRTHLGATLTAAHHAGVARLVVRSVAGPGHDPLRDVCVEIEAALTRLPLPTVAVRMSLVDTTELRDALASRGRIRADNDIMVAPLPVVDVVAALVALDAARGTRTDGHATFRLQGRPCTLAGLVNRIGDLVGRVFTPGRKVPLLAPSLIVPWVEPDDPAVADLLEFAGLHVSGDREGGAASG